MTTQHNNILVSCIEAEDYEKLMHLDLVFSHGIFKCVYKATTTTEDGHDLSIAAKFKHALNEAGDEQYVPADDLPITAFRREDFTVIDLSTDTVVKQTNEDLLKFHKDGIVLVRVTETDEKMYQYAMQVTDQTFDSIVGMSYVKKSQLPLWAFEQKDVKVIKYERECEDPELKVLTEQLHDVRLSLRRARIADALNNEDDLVAFATD